MVLEFSQATYTAYKRFRLIQPNAIQEGKTEELEQIDETPQEEQKEDKTDVFWGDDEATEGKSDEEDESEKDSNNEAKD